MAPALVFTTALLGAFTPALAQNAKLDIQNLEPLAKKASEVVDVNLDGAVLKLAAKFMTDEDDREGLEIVKNLKGIYVKNFEFDKPDEYSQADVETIRTQLQPPAWSRIVSSTSKHGGEISEVYLMMASDGGKVLGMAIINAEPKELTVVNIVGPIDMDQLSQLEGKMGIPRMGQQAKQSDQKPAGQHEKP
jgi:hypothetical protein